jgi:hypothetical protein
VSFKCTHAFLVILSVLLLVANCAAQISADKFPGADIGAKVNACIAQFSATSPGLCVLNAGTTYTLTTTIIKPQWVAIDGNNSVITVRSLSGPAIIAATTISLAPTYPGTYSRRGIRNLTLIGNGPSSTPYGIWLGGDPAGVFISPSATDFFEVFDNVHVQNFGTQYEFGSNMFQDTWLVGTIMGGYPAAEDGVTCATNMSGGENMAFIGTQFPSGGGSTGLAINCPNAYGGTITLSSVSVDFWGSNNASGCPNRLGTGQIVFNNGHLIIQGGHFETCSGPVIIANNASYQTSIDITGGAEFFLGDQTHRLTTPGIIEVNGGLTQNPSEDYIDHVLLTIGANQTVKSLIATHGPGGQFFCGPYYSNKYGRGYNQVPCRSGDWSAGFEAVHNSSGSISGFNAVGNFSMSGAVDQAAPNSFAGKCSMTSGKTCTFSTTATYTNYLSFVSIDQNSAAPARAISANCSLSGNTATITAGANNSLTWDCMFVGDPR